MSTQNRRMGEPEDPRQAFGRQGERQARQWLEARGWQVLAERFRVGRNEIDLIVRRGAIVAFVEVKARRGIGFGPGREAVGWRKQRAIARVAEVWRQRAGAAGDCYRFDVIEVFRAGGRQQLAHLEDAWRLTFR